MFLHSRFEEDLDLGGKRYPAFGLAAPFGGVQATTPIFTSAPDCGPLNMRLVTWPGFGRLLQFRI